MCHRWDSIPKEKYATLSPLERPSDVFSYTSFRGSFFEPRLRLRFETADTDMVAGIESGMKTILVLTGVTRQEDIGRFPYLPSRIAQSVAEIEP